MERRLRPYEELFDKDHARLLRQLDDVAGLCAGGSYVPAAKVFGEFRRAQERHLAREAEALEQLAALGVCPAALVQELAAEHAALTAAIDRAWVGITGGDHASFERDLRALIETLAAHEENEKARVLPLLRGALPRPALEDAVRRLID